MLKHAIARLFRDNECATAVEYAVMIAVIIVMCVTSIVMVGGQASNYWSNIHKTFDAAVAGS